MVVERASGKRAEDGLTLDRVLGTPTKSWCQLFSLFVVNREVESAATLSFLSINLSCDWADNQVVSGGFLFFRWFLFVAEIIFSLEIQKDTVHTHSKV